MTTFEISKGGEDAVCEAIRLGSHGIAVSEGAYEEMIAPRLGFGALLVQ